MTVRSWSWLLPLLVACHNPAPTPAVGGPDGDRQAGASACGKIGGSCEAVSACLPDAGHIADVSCQDGPSTVCCVMPATSCGGPEDFSCCAGSAVMRPVCVGGERLECGPGQTRAVGDTCPPQG